MEAGFIVLIAIVVFVSGIILGVFWGRTRTRQQETQGILYVDFNSPGSEPGLFLVCTAEIRDMVSLNHATFEIDVVGRNSQK